MNIFVVHESAYESANHLCDKHVVKMIVESAQMLSTAHRVLDGTPCVRYSKNNRKLAYWHMQDLYMEHILCKPTMVNHPCTKWTMETDANYNWLRTHATGLCIEYTKRYNKIHSMDTLINNILCQTPSNINRTNNITPFAQAMPDKYKQSDAVQAYRNYYIYEKSRFAKWNKSTPAPDWYTEGVKCINTPIEETDAILQSI
jgi:hypothetical protein